MKPIDLAQAESPRIALWAADGKPIATILLPLSLAGSYQPDSRFVAKGGLEFYIDHLRYQHAGPTVGNQLVLNLEDAARQLPALLKRMQKPVTVEALAPNDPHTQTGRAKTLTPEQVADLAASGVHVEYRHKLGHRVAILSFDTPERALEFLGGRPTPNFEPPFTADLFEAIDLARAETIRTKGDVHFEFADEILTIPFGKTAHIEAAAGTFSVEPNQPAKEAYRLAQTGRSAQSVPSR